MYGSSMAGKIKELIDMVIDKRSKGNTVIAATTRTKIILKGVNPDQFDKNSPDDPVVITKIKAIATEMGVTV
jgi:hypothetical protein